MSVEKFVRGSEWRQWDLHIHTPASFHWPGQRFDATPNSATNRSLVDQMIEAINAAEPAVFALMDYWTFDGWFALKRRLRDPDAPTLTKTVFPGIELRLAAPTTVRLNAHVLFSDAIPDQTLLDFKSSLTIELTKRPLSDAALIDLARTVGADLLKKKGLSKSEIDDDEKALRAGSIIADINCDSYKNAIASVPKGEAIGFMPFDTSDGLQEVKWHDHYSYFLGLFRSSPIFESRNIELRSAFVGERTTTNTHYFDSFQAGLSHIPRLVVSGSDAHQFVGVEGDNNKRGYGQFPSGKITWIKADPTFQGLRQAIMEPAKRSFIGALPPKCHEIANNKTFFVDSVSIKKVPNATETGRWLDGVNLPLSADLVAIIGNKGSGKSALADVVALLGNSRQKAHFSFLRKDRFRGKSGDPARQFVGTLRWLDGKEETKSLHEDPLDERVELVRYIPQGHFEELCNAHVSGKSDAFENELRAVIFSHAGEDIRLGALDFDQLVEHQERAIRSQLNEYRKELHALNANISSCEDQLQPEKRKTLQERLELKERQISEHQKGKPTLPETPPAELSPEQQKVVAQLEELTSTIRSHDEETARTSMIGIELAAKTKAIRDLREALRLLERAYRQFTEQSTASMATLNLSPADLVDFVTREQVLEDLSVEVTRQQVEAQETLRLQHLDRVALLAQQSALHTELNERQRAYQESLDRLAEWEAALREMTGSPESPDSLEGLRRRLSQLDALPATLESHRNQRAQLAAEIFDRLEAQRLARERLFAPVQELIQSDSLIREEYKLQFRATLASSVSQLSQNLFTLIKQNAGEFRGNDDESHAVVRRLADAFDFSKRDDALRFVSELYGKVANAAGSEKGTVGIGPLLRKDRSAVAVYDLIFGLSFLEPRYSLLFQDAQIEQLSPGQRGALLLIFYLLVDKGRQPIILDQPEENLDNETVVSLLVPVLTKAKRQRQIIMVTHNPNLAVVCDAEQIVWANFDRKDAAKITYTAGAIENPEINRRVVDVLEGTKPAFDNRRIKYR